MSEARLGYHGLTTLEDLCLDVDEEVHRVLTTKVFVRPADVIAAADWLP